MKKLLALLLCLSLALSFSTSAIATDISSEEPDVIPQKTEILSKRDVYSKTYLLPNGTYEYVGYAEPIHYKDSDDNYVEINNEITEAARSSGYKYTNTANSWSSYFSEKISDENAVMISNGDFSISFSLPGQISRTSAVKAVDLAKRDLSTYHQKLAADNRAVLYENIASGVDIAYTVLTGTLKEDIILKDKNTPNSFTFRLTANGLILKENGSTFGLFTSSNEEIFTFAPLYMEDANGKRSENVTLSFSSVKNGYEITITADPVFLNAADTVYPVVIDPSIMVTGSDVTYDTCVDQQYPNSNYYLSENLWTGGALETNAMRTYIKFTMPSGIPASQVTSAYISLLKKEHQVPTIKAYRVTTDWSSGSVTWNSQPSFTYSDCSDIAVNSVGDWYRLYVTSMITSWLGGVNPNYGFVLKEPAESVSTQKTKFYSSDAPSPNKPELHIVYTGNIPRINMYYDLYRSSAMTDSSSEVLSCVTQASADILLTFNVQFIQNTSTSTSALNQRPGCILGSDRMCTSICGTDNLCETYHHKSGNHFLFYIAQSPTRKVFSFVDFALCSYSDKDGHVGVNGLAHRNSGRMLVTLTSYNAQRTTCHEMSHLIGARDKVCTSPNCVMTYGSTVTNLWCSQCRSDIVNYLESIL